VEGSITVLIPANITTWRDMVKPRRTAVRVGLGTEICIQTECTSIRFTPFHPYASLAWGMDTG
jgi:hypothetical protein